MANQQRTEADAKAVVMTYAETIPCPAIDRLLRLVNNGYLTWVQAEDACHTALRHAAAATLAEITDRL